MDTTNTSVTATERYKLNKELAQMLKGGVIMGCYDTGTGNVLAEAAGACAVMALERIPADIRAAGGVSLHERPEDDSVAFRKLFHPCYG